jgi:7-carboxy-7-deazaguanine synthase
MPWIMTALLTITHRTNLLRQLPPGELLIHEVYRSIQGESTFAGLPCLFVRTAVCDLRCVWCDTPHAFTQGQRMPRAKLLQQILSDPTPLVELTGGEPLLQAEVLPLMQDLCDAGKTVLIETSGAHDVSLIDPRVHIIMDLKCPDSGECERNLWTNLDHLKAKDEIKFVIASRRDWEWAEQVIRERLHSVPCAILISAVFDRLNPRELVEWFLESGLNQVRMQLQMHKYIWDPKTRGV